MKQKMTEQERADIVSGLEYLLNESKIANAKINYSYSYQRLQHTVIELEARVRKIEKIFTQFVENNENK